MTRSKCRSYGLRILGRATALVFLSSLVLLLIFPGFEMHYLAWAALVPLFLLLRRSGLLTAILSSLAVGFVFHAGLLWWILRYETMHPFAFIFAHAVNATFFGIFGLLAYYFQKKLPHWNVLTFPALWVVMEYAKTHAGFLSFPWGILGYSQYTVTPIAGVAAFTGVYGVSFLIVAANAAIAEVILFYSAPEISSDKVPEASSRRRLKVSFGILAATVILFSATVLGGYSLSGTKSIRVALIQGNVYKSDTREPGKVFKKYLDLTDNAAGAMPELIVWPSASAPSAIPYNRLLVMVLSGLAQEKESFLLVGTSAYDKLRSNARTAEQVANSAFLFSPHGKIIGRYDKMRRLPFDEYIPLRRYITWPSWIVSTSKADSRPGTRQTIFKMDGTKFGVLICWENLFPDQFREMAVKGVDFMVSMTNEGFTDVPAAHYQMLAMNVLRAIENHVSVVRINSTGVSSIILPSGVVKARVRGRNGSDVGEEGYLVSDVPLDSQRTVYSRYGDWFIYALIIVICVFGVYAFRGSSMKT